MKNKDLRAVLEAHMILQSENLYVVGSARNIVELRNQFKNLTETENILYKKDSTEVWAYEKTDSNLLSSLVPVKDKNGGYVKLDENRQLKEGEMAYTCHPDELADLGKNIEELHMQEVDISNLSKFDTKSLENKENSGWFAKNENFAWAFQVLKEFGFFKDI